MTAIRIGGLATLLAGWILAAWFLWQTEVPADLALPEVEFRAQAAEDYARVPRGLWAGRTSAELALLAGLTLAGPWLARRLRYAPAVLVAVLAALWAVNLPFGATLHWWRRGHGLSDQGYLRWLIDPWLELLAGALLACTGLVLAILLARRLGPRWWIAGAPVLALLGAVSVLAVPVVQSPRLEPLGDGGLAAEIRGLGERLGVEVVAVDVKDARERTTRINAEAIGIGPTRRVVLWDTLLDGRASPGEVRVVAAHELAHVSQRHVWKGLAWFALATPLVLLALELATRRRGGITNPGAVPAAVLAAVAVQLALLPAVNAISRRYEAEADWVALRATSDPESAERLFRRFAEANLADPSPPAWAHVALGTHPSLVERVSMARAFRAGS